VIDGLAGLDPCVHCGFCLQSCPTYVATCDEADSPRGRIVLMQALARGDLPPSDRELTLHLNRCLGCRACESACPSGVEYGTALERTRASLARTNTLPWLGRIVLAVMADGRIRRPLLAASRLARPFARLLAGRSRMGFSMGMLAATRMPLDGKPHPEAAVATERSTISGRAGRAVIFRGCIMDDLFAHVHDATERTLLANGFTLATAERQGCCGALHAHAGLHDEAKALARQNIQAFREQPDAAVVVNAAGCGAILKDYGDLLRGDSLESEARSMADRVKDVTEVLAACGPRSGAPLDMSVAVDPPCHLQHAQRVVDQPLTVLGAIPGLDVCTPDNAGHCCGSAGVYSLLEPELSQEVLAGKLDALNALGSDVIATANPGCIMQIGAGQLGSRTRRPVVHPVELLDLSYRRAGYYSDLSDA
jgi:glycolate oxidase iron-sulfur subunit